MSDIKKVVPKAFYKGDIEKPYAGNVGELIKLLKKLPKDLPIRQGFGLGCRLTVFNIGSDPELEIGDDDD